MRKIVITFLFFVLVISCNKNNSSNDEKGPTLYPQPKSYSLNTKEGYKINSVTGDSIKPIVNSLGDTIKTGIKIPIKGKIIHSDSVSKPQTFPLPPNDQLTRLNAYPNRHKIPKDLTVIPVNKEALTRVFIEEITKDDTIHYIINSLGDTVKTGVPIFVKVKAEKTSQLQSTPVLPPRFKDNSIYNLRYLDMDQGMSSSNVMAILEDKRGNLWFGTYGSGSSMYNGESFTHFTQKEVLNHKYVRSIFEDKKGNLWFATQEGGISIYNGESVSNFTEKDGLSANYFSSIIEDRNGNLWFGTTGRGVSMYNGESFTHFTEKEGLSHNNVMSILEDSKGNLWLGTNGGGVNMFDGKSFTHFTEKDGLSNNKVLSIVEDNNGHLWFGTDGGGVSMYNGESFTYFTEKEGLSFNVVWSSLKDKNGNLWFGTYGGGVCKYDGETFVHFTENEGLSNNNIMSIFEDKKGNLWFGTLGGGVSIYQGQSFVNFTEKEGLSNRFVRSILEDKNGNLWFGTYGGGVSKYDGKSFTHYTEKEGLSNYTVMSITEDKKGNLWFGTIGYGVNKYDGETFTHYTEKEGLSSDFVYSVIEDKNGNLWFGTYRGGVSKYDGKNFIHYTLKEGLSNNTVMSIIEDRNGNLWFGTNGGGVSKFDGKTITHYTEKEGLSNNYVLSMLEDSKGNLWLGTNGGGVNRFDGESFIHYTEKEGLSNNMVWRILEDGKGNLWFSTDNGISCKEQKKLVENTNNFHPQLFTVFKKNDGLKGLDLSNGAYIDSKNRIWWGSNQSLTMLDMNKYTPTTEPPVVSMKRIEINEQLIDFRNMSDSLTNVISFSGVQQFENYPLNLELPYDQNHLTFHFIAIDWSAPHKIQYSYIMEGLNTSWSKPSPEAKADYHNMPYGTYTFKVRAIGASGGWSEPFEYTFTIHPPWWHTTWFRVLYVSCFVLLLYLLFRWRTNSLRKQKVVLEKTVQERTQELKHEKEIVEEKHKEITDSINYAERLQRSLMASKNLLDSKLSPSGGGEGGGYFIYFNPKESVSGDFYWASELKNGNFLLTCADSTGHGVPGAIMSMMNMNSLKESVKEGLVSPNEILNQTRKIIIDTLANDGSVDGGKDGMDCSLLSFDFKNHKLSFALANNPLWIIRQGEIMEFDADKMPVGKHDRDSVPFTHHEIDLQKGDLIFIFTDGYADQFGGEKGKKFKYSNLKKLLLENANSKLETQNSKLSSTFSLWKGDLEQVDDVCIIGIKI